MLNRVIKQKNPHRQKALFLHIQKTAGSSIVELARDFYPDGVISHGDYVGHKPEEFQDVGFVSGHFGYSYAKSLMDSRYSFTFLRDPAERILSFYFYNRTRDIDEFPMTRIAHELDLEQFLKAGLVDPLVKSRIWNNQTWQLSQGYSNLNGYCLDHYCSNELLDMAVNNLNNFSHIGFTESFKNDLNIILPNLGMPIRKNLVYANVTNNRLNLNDLPNSTLEILEELTELDKIIYEESRSIMKKKNMLEKISSSISRLFRR